MNQISITVPDDLQQWVESRIAIGHYFDASDYLRDLMRRDRASGGDDTEWVREQIAVGLASGVSDERLETIIDNIIARRRAG